MVFCRNTRKVLTAKQDLAFLQTHNNKCTPVVTEYSAVCYYDFTYYNLTQLFSALKISSLRKKEKHIKKPAVTFFIIYKCINAIASSSSVVSQ